MIDRLRYRRGLERKKGDAETNEAIRKLMEKPGAAISGNANATQDWVMLDSPATKNGNHYGDYIDSTRFNAPYEETFSDILDGVRLNQFINRLFKGKKNLIGLDVGGPGSRFFKSLSGKLFKNTYGLTLGKHTSKDLRPLDLYQENEMHRIIYGNMYDAAVRAEVRARISSPVDFIVSRMGAGYELAPDNPFTLFQTFNDFYSMLSDEGAMLVQMPAAHPVVLNRWLQKIEATHGKQIMFRQGDSKFGPVLFLKKKKGAPPTLPHLDKKEILSM